MYAALLTACLATGWAHCGEALELGRYPTATACHAAIEARAAGLRALGMWAPREGRRCVVGRPEPRVVEIADAG